MKVELHIDELILEGVPAFQREQVAAAIEQALTALVIEHGVPPGWQQGGSLAALTQEIKPGSRTDVIGRQVAQAILGNANVASQSVQFSNMTSMRTSVQNRNNHEVS
jgi:hypothetical protein